MSNDRAELWIEMKNLTLWKIKKIEIDKLKKFITFLVLILQTALIFHR